MSRSTDEIREQEDLNAVATDRLISIIGCLVESSIAAHRHHCEEHNCQLCLDLESARATLAAYDRLNGKE